MSNNVQFFQMCAYVARNVDTASEQEIINAVSLAEFNRIFHCGDTDPLIIMTKRIERKTNKREPFYYDTVGLRGPVINPWGELNMRFLVFVSKDCLNRINAAPPDSDLWLHPEACRCA